MREIFECSGADQVRSRSADITRAVSTTGFATIRGLFDRETIRSKLPSLFAYANGNSHRASAGVPPEDIRTNMTKWSIGGHSVSQAGLPRFMVTVYNPLWETDHLGLRSDFEKIIEVRDILAKREMQTDEALAPNRFNGCRVQIYPAGGGFMGKHVDSRAQSNLPDGAAYIQMVLLLTERGTDYTRGGAFVESGNRDVDSEEGSQSGDLLIYDGASNHGVADIDSHLPFVADDLRGRAVALATVYTK